MDGMGAHAVVDEREDSNLVARPLGRAGDEPPEAPRQLAVLRVLTGERPA
jgi:hypothetical protein